MENLTYAGMIENNTQYFPLHSHKAYEILYYTKGCGYIRFGNSIEEFSAGTLFIIAPNVSHMEYSDNGFQNLHFLFLRTGLSVFPYLKLEDSNSHEFFNILSMIHHEYQLKRKQWNSLVEGLYGVFIQYLLAFSQKGQNNRYIDQMISNIIENISNPEYSVNDAMSDLPFASNYFRELFFNQMGQTPLQYLMNKRMENAQSLIRNKSLTGYSFEEISRMCGYNDVCYFSRKFKQCTGLSPRNWYAREKV